MFTQLFGNYLLRKGVVTREQLTEALRISSESHIKLGTLAIHSGYMTPAEVDRIFIMQTHQDKRFGELAIEEGYLTSEQVDELLSQQNPGYLKLGQALVEQNVINHEQFEQLINEYQMENEIFDLDMMDEQKSTFQHLVSSFCTIASSENTDAVVVYLQLLFNNLIRFVGDDFTPLNIVPFNEYVTNFAASQSIEGPVPLGSAVDMDEQTAVTFASRYAGEDFTEFDEYCQASLEDFLNLHNGLYLVNMSNMYNVELTLAPTEIVNNTLYMKEGTTYLLPLIFTFGTVNFLFTVSDK